MFSPVALTDARTERTGFRASPALRESLVERRLAAPITAPDDYSRGLSDGQSLAEQGFASERAHLNALVAASLSAASQPNEELTALICGTVERLVREIVGQSPVDKDWLGEQVQRACEVIVDCDGAQTLWLHPDDAALLASADINREIGYDANAVRGTIRIDCSAGWIEHGRSPYLDALHVALGGAQS